MAHGSFEASRDTLESLDKEGNPLAERLGSPAVLRTIHNSFKENDVEAAQNRAAVQELIDFVPPYDPEELRKRGQGDRFNVNFGMVTAIVSEAVGSYFDIYNTPTALLNLQIESAVKEDDKEQWASIMSEEFTTMLRNWDAMTPQMLLLNNLLVTHGIAVPWFEDSQNMTFEVSSLEEFGFDDDAVAISSRTECATIERNMSVAKLFTKIDGKPVDEDGYTEEGYHVPTIKRLILNAQKGGDANQKWDYEELQRRLKSNRVTGGKNLESVNLVWGIVRELDGKYSVYAISRDGDKKANAGIQAISIEDSGSDEQWVFKQRDKYRDANQALQIFAFGVGNKLNIHTIRGLAYFLYEAGQADNVMGCKLLDAARMRATQTYQPQGGVESEKDMQILDLGHAVIIPQSLKPVDTPQGVPIDKSAGVAQDIIRAVMDRHSGGLASQGLFQNPAARRNELQVAAELDQLSKLLSFAINLYYPPFEKFLRELARRAFTQTQSDLETMELVRDMKKRITDRGVPEEMFAKIDFGRSKVSRVMGAGSRGSRMMIYTQMSQLFAEMDDIGKEFFNFDWATELVGHDKALRYFGRPGERREHMDVAIARLENARLAEGDYIEPTDGQNNMVHLRIHVTEGLEGGLEAVEDGEIPLQEYVLNNVTLYEHTVNTMERTTVHESSIPELKAMRQKVQQIGEVIQNGLRQIQAEQRRAQEQGAAQQQEQMAAGGQPDPAQQAQQAEQQKMAMEREKMLFELQAKMQEAAAKIEMMQRQSEAKIAIQQQEAMAKIAMLDAEIAAKVKRAEIIESAKTR